ncbi:kinase family protein [Corchorus olitorius]|uniref:Kinase family protein n=1 Tax=Corchorus olitorius TaxID=93759 RepID=A0A1R3ITA9_9ROSI|nr:kinase family protein [Corchorus olitorius]
MVEKLSSKALSEDDPSEYSSKEDPSEHDDPTYHPESDDDSPTMSINKAFQDHTMDDKNAVSTSSPKTSKYDPIVLKFVCICEALEAAQDNLKRLTKFVKKVTKDSNP